MRKYLFSEIKLKVGMELLGAAYIRIFTVDSFGMFSGHAID